MGCDIAISAGPLEPLMFLDWAPPGIPALPHRWDTLRYLRRPGCRRDRPRSHRAGTWSAAYLVLVCGVAQAGLGLGQALSTSRTPTIVIAVQAIGWNLGNAAVIAGTLTAYTALVDVGGALLFVILILLARGLTATGGRPADRMRRWFRYGYGLLILILLVSIPVGVILAHLRT